MEQSASKQITDIVSTVENELGVVFESVDIADVLEYTMRKLVRLQKGPEYFPVLFHCELENHHMISEINQIGGMNRCHSMPATA